MNTTCHLFAGNGDKLSIFSQNTVQLDTFRKRVAPSHDNEITHHMNKAPYFRVRFADGYIFRIAARDVGDLRHRAATHYWWGDEKPPVDQVTLTLQRHRRKAGLVHYDAKAPGFPKLVVG